MKKNSGQVLIIFLIMIPILLSFIAVIAEAGYLFSIKNEYANVSKEAIGYALKSNNENKKQLIENYIKTNIKKYSSLDVSQNDDRVRVVLIKNQNSIFTKMIKEFKYTVKIDYVGYTDENNKIIIKE